MGFFCEISNADVIGGILWIVELYLTVYKNILNKFTERTIKNGLFI